MDWWASYRKEKWDAAFAENNPKLRVAGMDEVGRGCLAGPVFVGICVLNYERLAELDPKVLKFIRDSKKLSPKQRELMSALIREELAHEYAISSATHDEVDSLGIQKATQKAFLDAFVQIQYKIDLLIVDGNQTIPAILCDQKALPKADATCLCVSAASILAKVARDKMMQEVSSQYPNYGFEKHVGYGTKAHQEAIQKFGITPIHRKSFRIKALL